MEEILKTMKIKMIKKITKNMKIIVAIIKAAITKIATLKRKKYLT
ncbi:hypothetical protein [Methanotorris igneus]|nr:hypothetical protein [Methanotorris igneus]